MKRAISATAVALACLMAGSAHGQSEGTPSKRKVLSGEVFAESLSSEFIEATEAYIHELILPAGSVAGISGDSIAIRLRYKAVPFFAVDSAELDSRSLELVGRLADAIKSVDGVQGIVVAGHTDSTGSADYNVDLAQRRAESVVAALIANKVPPGRITYYAFGEGYPIATNSSEDGRARNRRVEIFLSENPAAAAEAPRARTPLKEKVNSQPECKGASATKACIDPDTKKFPRRGSDGAPKGEIDMKLIQAKERELRRPLNVLGNLRKPLPEPKGKRP